MAEQQWTYIVRCTTCGRECNRAEHVPERDRTRVVMSAPFMARCSEASHNTFSDLNWRYDAEWVPETPEAAEEDTGRAEQRAKAEGE